MHIVAGQRVSRWVIVVASLLLAGCSTDELTAPVEGVVLLDGKPLADIRVTFQPMAGSNRPQEAGVGSTGVTDANGHFVLRRIDNDRPGAVVASHMVTFSDMRAEEETSDVDAGPEKKAIPLRLPAKYSTESLKFDVKAGQTNEPKFELTGKP